MVCLLSSSYDKPRISIFCSRDNKQHRSKPLFLNQVVAQYRTPEPPAIYPITKSKCRSIQPPVPSLGQEQARSRRGGSEWVHSGQLGHTQVFIRPPRQSRARSGGGTVLASSTGNGKRSSAAIIRDRGASLADKTGSATPRATAGERGYNRLEGEDAWSCCGRTVASAGWGCGPRGPLATVNRLFFFV